jgi:enamine deaminase RidA (YjgF/YER057c/UK114 family)
MWGAVNNVYIEVMGEARPSRVVVPVKELHYGFKIEIAAVAATEDA